MGCSETDMRGSKFDGSVCPTYIYRQPHSIEANFSSPLSFGPEAAFGSVAMNKIRRSCSECRRRKQKVGLRTAKEASPGL
jgi:hypothetical protein